MAPHNHREFTNYPQRTQRGRSDAQALDLSPSTPVHASAPVIGTGGPPMTGLKN